MRKTQGFTLIELMVVIAVLAIIVTIAIPSYNDSVRKSRRSAAFQGIGDIQLKLEKHRANNAAYVTTLATIQAAATDPSGHYTYAVAAPSGNCADPDGAGPLTAPAASLSNSYRITATTAGAQADDTACATIVLTNLCGVVTKTSTPSGGVCWR